MPSTMQTPTAHTAYLQYDDAFYADIHDPPADLS